MEWLIWIVAINWGAPLLLWLYPLFMMLVFKDFVFSGFYGPFAKFKLATKAVEPWHARAWRDWGGVGLFGFMCYRDEDGKRDDAWVARTVVHEGTHCWQWLFLGLLFYATYMSHMLFILFFQRDRHPYMDCWAERMARKRAGQRMDFTSEEWPQGPKDRWPWW
jgi:hypothetical protein